MAWMRAICGRLKSDYSYTVNHVYNNFPWPSSTQEQKAKIERAAQKRGITVSEYLRQAVGAKVSRERPTDWYPTVARLEEICSEADGQVREELVELIRSLYQGGA
jgi:hypothetical protein